MVDQTDLLVSSDSNSLCSSAMAHWNWKRPKAQQLSSVNIEKIVRYWGFKMDVLKGFICRFSENNSFEKFFIDMTERKKNFKKKTLLQTSTKNCSSSVYGRCIGKDIEESYNWVGQKWMKTEYDDSVKGLFPLRNGNIMVKKDAVHEGLSKKIS